MTGYIYIIQNKVPEHKRFGWRYVGKSIDYEHLVRRIRSHFEGIGNKLLSRDIATPETINLLREGKLGENNPFYGKKRPEHGALISKIQLGKKRGPNKAREVI